MSADGGVILVGGEALFDVVAGDSDALEAHPGGARSTPRGRSPASSSRSPTSGACRPTASAQRLERILVDDGVSLEAVVRTEDPTTLALAELGDGGSVVALPLLQPGHVGAGPDVRGGARRAARRGRDPVRRHARARARADGERATRPSSTGSRARDTLVAVDPNCRPGVIDDAAAYRRAAAVDPRARAPASRSPRRTSRSSTPTATRSRRRGRCSPTARRSACSRAAATARSSSPHGPRGRRRRRRGRRSSTRSAPATRSRAASCPGGASATSAPDDLADLDTVVEAARLRLPRRRADLRARRRIAPLPPRAVTMEIERKFLVAAGPGRLDAHPSTAIEQGYLAIHADGTEVRIRRRDGVSTLTVKSAAGCARRGGARDRRRRVRAPVAAHRGPTDREGPPRDPDRRRPGSRSSSTCTAATSTGLVVAEVEFPGEAEAEASSRRRGSGRTSPTTRGSRTTPGRPRPARGLALRRSARPCASARPPCRAPAQADLDDDAARRACAAAPCR